MTLRNYLLLMFAVCACDSTTVSGPPCSNPDGGSFTGTATDNGSLAGCSSYAITSTSGSPAMGLVLSSGPIASPTVMVNLGRLGDRPAVGSYSVGTGPSQFIGSVVVNPGNNSFSLTGGTITIDVSTVAGVDGTLGGTINVTGTRSGAGGTINVTGNFTAVCTVTGSVTC